ncbi:MAG: RsmB/NOP family class I SAM-dependent RNA methyltransferase, partial [Desulfovibrio sp.]|nr:RsmB/NOP family class I SAM-dependent RNA methyltransferase [Desulfovibrio sp.]
MHISSSEYRSFRIVAPQANKNSVCALLKAQDFVFCQEPFHPDCYKLKSAKIPLGRSLAAQFGYIYIQDRSSMLPCVALEPHDKTVVLDMCASPGSKTSFLAQFVGQNGLVLANEPQPTRLQTLIFNLRRLNLIQTITTSASVEQLPFPVNSFSN